MQPLETMHAADRITATIAVGSRCVGSVEVRGGQSVIDRYIGRPAAKTFA
jgi:hypothetical protein